MKNKIIIAAASLVAVVIVTVVVTKGGEKRTDEKVPTVTSPAVLTQPYPTVEGGAPDTIQILNTARAEKVPYKDLDLSRTEGCVELWKRITTKRGK